MMAVTYDSITTVTVANGTTNSITLSSIPSTFTDLVLVLNGGLTVADNVAGIRVNGNSSAIYSNTLMRGGGSTANSYREFNQTQAYVGWYPYPRSNAQAQVETGNMICQFMNYSNTTTKKTIITRSNTAYGDSGTQSLVTMWSSTAAINSITVLLTATGNPYFTVGTMLTLYGIKAA